MKNNIFQKNTFFSIAFREFHALFSSPVGYILFLAFSIILALLYQTALEQWMKISVQHIYIIAPISCFLPAVSLSMLILIIIPSIAMKTITEERLLGTYSLLLSYPISEWNIILGKFLGLFSYYFILWIPSIICLLVLNFFNPLDYGQLFIAYFYIMLSGACFISLGILASSLFRSQLLSWSISFLFILPFHSYIFFGQTKESSYFFISSWEYACRGTISTYHFSIYLLLIFISLYFSVKILWQDRWISWNIISYQIKFYFPFFWATLLILSLLCLHLWYELFFKFLPYIILFGLISSSTFLYLHYRKNIDNSFFHNIVYLFLLRIASIFSIVIMLVYFSYIYQSKLDCSQSQAFSIPSKFINLLKEKLPHNDSIHAIVFLGYTEQHQHEHTERDNERYFILTETLRKISDSFNGFGDSNFSYEFLFPATQDNNTSRLVQQQKTILDRIAQLQNQYGVLGYREILLLYRNKSYILHDSQLFEKRLTRQQVPKLCLLWRRIYESGGIDEPPPQDFEEAFQKLQTLANLEMLSIFPHPQLEQNLINAILQLLDTSSVTKSTKKIEENGKRIIYFTQGQGEYDIQGTLADDTYTAYRLIKMLKRYNFEVKHLNIANITQIPNDCNCLIILGTSYGFDWDKERISVIEKYLIHRQGKILIALSSENSQTLTELLNKYDLEIPVKPLCRYYINPMRKVQKSNIFTIENFSYPPVDDIFLELQEQENATNLSEQPFIISQSIPILKKEKTDQSLKFCPILPIPPNLILDPENSSDKVLTNDGTWNLGWLVQGKNLEKLIVLGSSSFCSDTPYFQSGMQNSMPQILIGNNRLLLITLLEFLLPRSKPILIPTKQPKRFDAAIYQFANSSKNYFHFETKANISSFYWYIGWIVCLSWPFFIAWVCYRRNNI